MERLTTHGGSLIKCFDCTDKSNCFDDICCNYFYISMETLSAYEDTGLTPQEVSLVKKLTIQYLDYTIAENTEGQVN